jgi:hypothetical protein
MMKIFDVLTNKNFALFAANHYNNPECVDVEEFKEDLSRFKYLKRLLRRYEVDGDLQERLIINHLIVLYNVFGIEATNRMLMFKIPESRLTYIKPFMLFLNYIRDTDLIDVPMDDRIVERLRNL